MSETVTIDFFQTKCQTGPHAQKLFGVCDVPNGGMAYVDVHTPNNWIAKVHNEQELNVMFAAIDGCVLPNDQGPKRCDAMLTTAASLHLVELKDQRRKGWVNTAIEQLESTIELFKTTQQRAGFRVFTAHICNKKRPYIHESRREMCDQFHAQHDFHLKVSVDIQITE